MIKNIVEVNYAQTGKSTNINKMGMREMQERAYNAKDAKYLLLKAPPASGKSRALMFIALDKLYNQGIKKVIVAVPEKSIGGSFSATKLTENGFFADWQPQDAYNGTVASQIVFYFFAIFCINFSYFCPNMFNMRVKIAEISPKN